MIGFTDRLVRRRRRYPAVRRTSYEAQEVRFKIAVLSVLRVSTGPFPLPYGSNAASPHVVTAPLGGELCRGEHFARAVFREDSLMARFVTRLLFLRPLALTVVVFVLIRPAYSQVLSIDDTTTPQTPGVGHD